MKEDLMAEENASERTPLIVPPPITTDASLEAALDGSVDEEDHDSRAGDNELSNFRLAIASVALTCLILLQATNISLISVTQSSIADDLDASQSTSWFTSAYLIAMSSLAPLYGKLAAVFSPRICIFAASIVLAAGTFISGLSNDFTTFILGRVITGLGSSGVFTVSIIVILDLSSPLRRGLNIGLMNTGYTIGVAFGAVAAGATLPSLGWRGCFFIQTPLSLISGLAFFAAIPSSFLTSNRSTKTLSWQLSQLDYVGAATLTTTIVLILYALSAPGSIPIVPLLVAPVTLIIFVIIEMRFASDPIIPVSLLRSRGLLLTCLGTVGYMMSRWAVLFYSPTYAIALRSWSPTEAGAVLIPTNAAFACGGLLAGWLHIRKHGSFYWATLIVYAIFPLTLVWLAFLMTKDSPIALFVLDLVICGGVTGAALNYNLAHALYLTPKSTHYIVSSLLATFRGFSGSFGSATGGGIFTRTLYQSLETGFADHDLKNEALIKRLLGSPALVQQLDGIEKEIAARSYETAFRTLFLAGAALSTLAVLVQAGAGWKGAPEEIDDTDHRSPHGQES